MAQGWQSFATAPRDGSLFDVWVPSDHSGWRVVNLCFRKGKLYREGQTAPISLPRWPSHWMLPPEAPAA